MEMIKLLDHREYVLFYVQEEYKIIKINRHIDIYRKKEKGFEKIDKYDDVFEKLMKKISDFDCEELKEDIEESPCKSYICG